MGYQAAYAAASASGAVHACDGSTGSPRRRIEDLARAIGRAQPRVPLGRQLRPLAVAALDVPRDPVRPEVVRQGRFIEHPVREALEARERAPLGAVRESEPHERRRRHPRRGDDHPDEPRCDARRRKSVGRRDQPRPKVIQHERGRLHSERRQTPTPRGRRDRAGDRGSGALRRRGRRAPAGREPRRRTTAAGSTAKPAHRLRSVTASLRKGAARATRRRHPSRGAGCDPARAHRAMRTIARP